MMEERNMLLKAEGIRRDHIRQGKGTNVFTAVKETDLSLFAGKLYVLTGRSGSGKTTLIHMLSGLLTPSAGRVLYLDGDKETDIYALEDGERARLRNLRIGYIPQESASVQALTVKENILLPYTLYGERADEEELLALSTRLDIAGLMGERPKSLSGGELRRMSIARAVLRGTRIIFADEPTGDLDDRNTQEVLRLLRERADAGCAVLISTHEGAAKEIADVTLAMDGGVLK